MTRPIEHDKIRDALFFQLEPILSAFERAYHIESGGFIRSYPYSRKAIRRTIKDREGL